jgi:hypothetical protein
MTRASGTVSRRASGTVSRRASGTVSRRASGTMLACIARLVWWPLPLSVVSGLAPMPGRAIRRLACGAR